MSEPLRGELNPEHGVLAEVREHWYKIAAILVRKANLAAGKPADAEMTITAQEIAEFSGMFAGETPTILYYPKDDAIRLTLLPESAARRKMQH